MTINKFVVIIVAIILMSACNSFNFPAPFIDQNPTNSFANVVLATATEFQPNAVTPTIAIGPNGEITINGTPQPTPTALPPLADLTIPLSAVSGEDHVNVLLIGSDRRQGGAFRTDTLIIASIRPKDQLVTLISIPRDLYVFIPGWQMNRINTAYLHGDLNDYPGGGAELLKETIQHNLGIEIHHYAVLEFKGFIEVVDTLGGVDIPLACPWTELMKIDPEKPNSDQSNWEMQTIGPGVVHMDGDLALWYVRARQQSSDFDRGRRQQEVLRALYKKGMDSGVLPQIPSLYQQFQETVTTDITLPDLLEFIPLALELDNAQIRSYYINHRVVYDWISPGGAYVLMPNQEALSELLSRAMSPPKNAEDERLKTPVEIINFSGNDGFAKLAAERLAYGGFHTTVIPNEGETVPETVLYDLSPQASDEQSDELLELLGFDQTHLDLEPVSSGGKAFRLVLGEDYDPCFNPADIER